MTHVPAPVCRCFSCSLYAWTGFWWQSWFRARRSESKNYKGESINKSCSRAVKSRLRHCFNLKCRNSHWRSGSFSFVFQTHLWAITPLLLENCCFHCHLLRVVRPLLAQVRCLQQCVVCFMDGLLTRPELLCTCSDFFPLCWWTFCCDVTHDNSSAHVFCQLALRSENMLSLKGWGQHVTAFNSEDKSLWSDAFTMLTCQSLVTFRHQQEISSQNYWLRVS